MHCSYCTYIMLYGPYKPAVTTLPSMLTWHTTRVLYFLQYRVWMHEFSSAEKEHKTEGVFVSYYILKYKK